MASPAQTGFSLTLAGQPVRNPCALNLYTSSSPINAYRDFSNRPETMDFALNQNTRKHNQVTAQNLSGTYKTPRKPQAMINVGPLKTRQAMRFKCVFAIQTPLSLIARPQTGLQKNVAYKNLNPRISPLMTTFRDMG